LLDFLGIPGSKVSWSRTGLTPGLSDSQPDAVTSRPSRPQSMDSKMSVFLSLKDMTLLFKFRKNAQLGIIFWTKWTWGNFILQPFFWLDRHKLFVDKNLETLDIRKKTTCHFSCTLLCYLPKYLAKISPIRIFPSRIWYKVWCILLSPFGWGWYLKFSFLSKRHITGHTSKINHLKSSQ